AWQWGPALRGLLQVAFWVTLLVAALVGEPGLAQTPSLDLPTDRLIVRLRDPADATTDREGIRARSPMAAARAQSLSVHVGAALSPVRAMGGGAQVLRLGEKHSMRDVQRLAARLRTHPDVLDAIPDRIVLPQFTP